MSESKFGEFFRKTSQKLFGKRMIISKSKKDLEKMRAAGELIASVREELREMIEPGISTLELNNAAEKMIRDGGAYPTFLGYQGFPYSICASVNEAVVHGFPSDYTLKDGDIFSMDMGATLEGFVGDTATTVLIGDVDEAVKKLVKVTAESLELAIDQCRPGKRVGDIGWAVQQHAEKYGYGIVLGYTGHGIGRNMHEAPQIPNHGRPGTKEKIRKGFVFAIEPMLNLGTHETKTLEDGWTVVTADGKASAHSEHTVAIMEEGPEILTLTKDQKKVLRENRSETVAA